MKKQIKEEIEICEHGTPITKLGGCIKCVYEKRGKLQTLSEVEKMLDDYLDSLYFEKFDELKFYPELRYKKDMKKKFIEIFNFWIEKNEELKSKLKEMKK